MFWIFFSKITRLHDDFKSFFVFKMIQHPFKIAIMVSFDEKCATWFENFVASIQKWLLKKSFFVVASFWPWIWKKIEDRLDFTFIKHKLKSLPSGTKVAEVFDVDFIKLFRQSKTALEAVIQSNKIYFGIFLAVFLGFGVP